MLIQKKIILAILTKKNNNSSFLSNNNMFKNKGSKQYEEVNSDRCNM